MIDTEELIVELYKKGINLELEVDNRGLSCVKVANENNQILYGGKGETVEEALAKIFKRVLLQKQFTGQKKVGRDTLSLL